MENNRNFNNVTAEFYEVDDNGWTKQRVKIQHCNILYGTFRNFAGKAKGYSSEGDRYINAEIPYDLVHLFTDQGITVGHWKGGDEEDKTTYFVKVKINFKKLNELPHVWVREGENGTWNEFNESTVGMLDTSRFVDTTIIANISRGLTRTNQPYATLYLNVGLFTKRATTVDTYEAAMYAEYGLNPNGEINNSEEMPFA